jgi:adenylate cyclase
MSDASVNRKLAAILSADVVGYSRLMADDEVATVETLKQYRAEVGRIIERHKGRIVNAPGDNILAEFASAVEAVRAAVEIQRSIQEKNADLAEERRMRFRVGVNLGDIIEEADGTIYGDGVNIAARLEALAEEGGICISSTIHDAVEGKLDFGFEFLGERPVKNIARPVRVYRVRNVSTAMKAPTGADRPMPLPDKPSIAVLPFNNLSGDPEQDYFADGIAEDLITELSRIRWLLVTARNSTFTYKGRAIDVRQIGRDLGVRYVVEGSVRKGGERVRISAQLLDAATGNHIWAERYDRSLADVFVLQDEITETLVAQLQAEVGEFERKRARRKRPDSLDAWESYQRGLWHVYQFADKDVEEARVLFRRAIELDQGFGSAYTGLGYTYFLDSIFGWGNNTDNNIQQSFRATKKALALDDRDAMAHYTLGRLYMLLGDQESALGESQRAIELNPSLALGHFGLGHALMLLGKPDDAIAELDTAMQLSPRDPIMWVFEYTKATALILIDHLDMALDYARRATRHANSGLWAWIAMTSVLGHLGRAKEGHAALQKLLDIKPDFAPEFIQTYLPFDREEDHQRYVDGLRKAGLKVPAESK